MFNKTLFVADYILIQHDRDGGWLYTDWRGYQSVETVKEGCEMMLELVQKYSFTKVLNDNTNVLGIWSGASEWVAVDWFPRMYTAGMKYFAWVYSPGIFSRMSTDRTLASAHDKVAEVFYNLEEARQWLRSVE